jgi:hypothetical protein
MNERQKVWEVWIGGNLLDFGSDEEACTAYVRECLAADIPADQLSFGWDWVDWTESDKVPQYLTGDDLLRALDSSPRS